MHALSDLFLGLRRWPPVHVEPVPRSRAVRSPTTAPCPPPTSFLAPPPRHAMRRRGSGAPPPVGREPSSSRSGATPGPPPPRPSPARATLPRWSSQAPTSGHHHARRHPRRDPRPWSVALRARWGRPAPRAAPRRGSPNPRRRSALTPASTEPPPLPGCADVDAAAVRPPAAPRRSLPAGEPSAPVPWTPRPHIAATAPSS